jgi:hypothetical protein
MNKNILVFLMDFEVKTQNKKIKIDHFFRRFSVFFSTTIEIQQIYIDLSVPLPRG